MSPAPRARIRNKRNNKITGIETFIRKTPAPPKPDSKTWKKKPIANPPKISRLLILEYLMSMTAAAVSSARQTIALLFPLPHLRSSSYFIPAKLKLLLPAGVETDYKSKICICKVSSRNFFIFGNISQKTIEQNSINQRKPADTKGSDCQKADGINSCRHGNPLAFQ